MSDWMSEWMNKKNSEKRYWGRYVHIWKKKYQNHLEERITNLKDFFYKFLVKKRERKCKCFNLNVSH